MTAELVTLEGLPALERLGTMVGQAPPVCFFWLRDALFRSALAHRNEFLRRTGVKLNRRPTPATPDPIRATRVGEVAGADPERDILWIVTPAERRRQGGPEILADLGVHIFTENPVLIGQELGGEVAPRSGHLLAVPIAVPAAGVRRSRKSPRAYRRAHPEAVLLALRSKRTGHVLLFERIRRRVGQRTKARSRYEEQAFAELRRKEDARVAAGAERGQKLRRRRLVFDRLVPRWALLPSLSTAPRLEFHSTWRALKAARERFFDSALRKIAADIARGVLA